MNPEKVILIVDDSEFDRKLLVNALSRKGKFKILEANSGDQCLEMVKTHPIDLILMDVVMPGTVGTQVLTDIRKKFNPILLPIIMITANSETSDVIDALQLGANDYVTKPVNFDVAISRITTHLKLSEVSRETAKLQEIAGLHAMVTTYNHEINNPLAIAVAGVQELAINKDNKDALMRVESSLWRIVDVVKRIKEVTEKAEITYASYVGDKKMVKVN